jgi:predicted trehalose synthase
VSDLLSWVAQQRWFRSKARKHRRGEVLEEVELEGVKLLAYRVDFEQGEPEVYALAMKGSEDGLADVAIPLAKMIESNAVRGPLHGQKGPAFEAAFSAGFPAPRVLSAEQSNSAVLFGDKAILKVYRRLVEGENPEVEILRALSTRNVAVPRLVGTVDWGGCAFAMIQQFVPNRGDAWSVVLASDDSRADVALAQDLGARTAELHLALADAFGLDVVPVRTGPVREHARKVLADLGDARLSAKASDLDARIARAELRAPAIRVHGDYHLGQVLVRNDGEPVILDFEGEPARSLEERRAKYSPFKDVAGMLRSFAYASATKKVGDDWTDRVSFAFLDAYRAGVSGTRLEPRTDGGEAALLDFFLLEKALYEIEYERNNRPDWLPIPVEGVLALLSRSA